MSVAPTSETSPSDPRPRRSWFGAAVAASIAVHILLLGWLLLPGVEALPAPGEPVNVDLVTESEAAAESAASASEQAASGASVSSETSAAASASSSAEPPSASSAPQASEPSSAPASQQEPASSAPTEPSAEPAAASAPRAPTPMPRPPAPQGRVTVPVGETASSAEAASASAQASGAPSSAAASEEAPAALTTTGEAAEGAADGSAASEAPSSSAAPSSAEEDAPLMPIGGGALTPATRFFLEDMLAAPALSQVRDAIGELPPEARLAQTCNIEAMGQASGAGFSPDAIIPNAFAAPAIVGSSYRVAGGAFRTGGAWRRIAYECRLSEDLSDVASFNFNIGADVTAEMEARLNAD